MIIVQPIINKGIDFENVENIIRNEIVKYINTDNLNFEKFVVPNINNVNTEIKLFNIFGCIVKDLNLKIVPKYG